MKFYGTAKVGVKGQIVIPVEAREALDLKEGDKLLVISPPVEKGIVLIKADSLESLMQDISKDLQDMQKIAKNHKGGKNE